MLDKRASFYQTDNFLAGVHIPYLLQIYLNAILQYTPGGSLIFTSSFSEEEGTAVCSV